VGTRVSIIFAFALAAMVINPRANILTKKFIFFILFLPILQFYTIFNSMGLSRLTPPVIVKHHETFQPALN